MTFEEVMFSDGAKTVNTCICSVHTGNVWFAEYKLVDGVISMTSMKPIYEKPDAQAGELPTKMQEHLAVLTMLPPPCGIPGVGYKLNTFMIIISRKGGERD
jgi:hypothetical protein